MIKLLELTQKQILTAAAIMVVAGIGLIVFLGFAMAGAARQANTAWGSEAVTSTAEAETKELAPTTSKKTVDKKGKDFTAQPTQTAPTHDPVTSKAETPKQPTERKQSKETTPKTTKQQGAHIPYTNKPVTPGDPESYVGTVGQCPFYEIAGAKGCIVPPYIECNENWTVCNYIGDTLDKLR